ncbi:hypothetical protein [Salinimicrobium gaetbulicola]|uniref:GLPGLI family protein n=1 Tax=Salinimicrobium gaetbulicola TaxID=999702 RepID=A0ABW3IHJ3_9FLAO
MGKKLLIFIFLHISYSASSQLDGSVLSFYSEMDKFHQIQNQRIVNGVEYRDLYRTINNKHSFLKGRDFQKALLFYNDQLFPEISIRYDFFRDIVVAKIQIENGQVYIIQLINDLLENFTVGQQKFINVTFDNKVFENGFYEILAKSDCASLLKKRRFRPLEKRDKSYMYYEFEEIDTQRIINISGNYIKASKKELIEMFPKNKGEIKEFYKKNRSLRKLNEDKFYQELTIILSKISCS